MQVLGDRRSRSRNRSRSRSSREVTSAGGEARREGKGVAREPGGEGPRRITSVSWHTLVLLCYSAHYTVYTLCYVSIVN